MWKSLVWVALLCVVQTPGNVNAASVPMKVVVLGDSLSSGYQLLPEQGFAPRLERKMRELGYDVTVVNMSVAGDTTQSALTRLPMAVAERPDLVILELGGNDAIRGIDPKVVESNLTNMVETLQGNNIFVLLAGMYAPPNFGKDYVKKFSKAYDNLRIRYQVTVYPFFLEGVATKPELNLADGYHPNAEGVNVIVDNITPYVDYLLRYRIHNAYRKQWLEGSQ
jgi:acyl-CoA thioesterase I